MNIKKIIGFLKVLLIATIIEVVLFDLSDIMYYMKNYQQLISNEVLSMSSAMLINWDSSDEGYISKEDPMIVYEGLNTKLQNIQIQIISDSELKEAITVFYMSDANSELRIASSAGLIDNTANIRISEDVYSLRIDLGESAGFRLNDCLITLNSTEAHFSFSRIVAMLIVYYVTGLLFRLQKSPEYKLGIDESEVE